MTLEISFIVVMVMYAVLVEIRNRRIDK